MGFVDSADGAARLSRQMVERVLTHCENDQQAAEPLLILCGASPPNRPGRKRACSATNWSQTPPSRRCSTT